MRRFVVAGLAFVMFGLALACGEGDETPIPNRTTLNPTPAQRDQANVNRLCDYFYVRAIETLASAGAKATVTDLVNQPGIPDRLRSAALVYFEMTDKKSAYRNVITRCQSEGWTS